MIRCELWWKRERCYTLSSTGISRLSLCSPNLCCSWAALNQGTDPPFCPSTAQDERLIRTAVFILIAFYLERCCSSGPVLSFHYKFLLSGQPSSDSLAALLCTGMWDVISEQTMPIASPACEAWGSGEGDYAFLGPSCVGIYFAYLSSVK